MEWRMTTSDLLQAIDRLDQAVTRAEAAVKRSQEISSTRREGRDAIVRRAMSELDGLISSLEERTDG